MCRELHRLIESIIKGFHTEFLPLPTGFTGQLCENEINPCEPSPCHGGARCIPQPPQTSGPTQPDTPEAMFRCECPGPYTGLTCETVLTASQECPTHTELHCLNGGICRRDPAQGLEMCECKPHFYGPDCAKSENLLTICLSL